MRCPDCPDLPNGTRKRQICCRREGGKLKIGDVVPFVPMRRDIRIQARSKGEAMKAVIAVDDWKLPVFRKRLTEAGYHYEDGGELVGDTTLLTVEANDMLRLKAVLEECQAQCAKQRASR